MRSLEAYCVNSKWYDTHHAHGFQQIVLEILYPILTTRTWVLGGYLVCGVGTSGSSYG
jgi:hypothetical protein